MNDKISDQTLHQENELCLGDKDLMIDPVVDDKLVCKICGKRCKDFNGISSHIVQKHKISKQSYYDLYHKTKDEGICYCKNKTTFSNIRIGYLKYCSPKCVANSDELKVKRINTCLKKYGIDNPFRSKKIQKQIKQTNLEKYGYEYPLQSEKIQEKQKQTNLKLYGYENPNKSKEIKQKKIQTNLEHWGVENPSKSKEIKEKKRKTCFENWGVNSPMQSNEIREKSKYTNLKRYGYEYPSKSKEIQEKMSSSWKNKTDEEILEIKNKTKKTCSQKYGEDHFSKTFNGRKICRENYIKMVQTQKLNGEPLGPRIGSQERNLLDTIQKHTKYIILRNYPIIGYFPDGYIKELNLVIEYDEKWHNQRCYIKKDNQKNKDYQQENLNLFRVSEKDWINNKEQVINQFKQLIEESECLKKN